MRATKRRGARSSGIPWQVHSPTQKPSSRSITSACGSSGRRYNATLGVVPLSRPGTPSTRRRAKIAHSCCSWGPCALTGPRLSLAGTYVHVGWMLYLGNCEHCLLQLTSKCVLVHLHTLQALEPEPVTWKWEEPEEETDAGQSGQKRPPRRGAGGPGGAGRWGSGEGELKEEDKAGSKTMNILKYTAMSTKRIN